MSAASQNVTINCTVATGTSAQTWTVASGRTLTIPTISMGAGEVLSLTASGSMTLGSMNTGNGSGGVIVTGSGSITGTDINIQKGNTTYGTAPTAASPISFSTTTGFYVNGPTISLTTLELGTGNAGGYGRVDSGSVTVSGAVVDGANGTTRWSGLQVNGGTFTCNDTTTGITIAQNNGSATTLSELYVAAGTLTAGKISFGKSTDTVGGSGFFLVKGGNCYVGSGGIVRATTVGAYVETISLYSGLLGATADWSSAQPIVLSGVVGTPFTIQAADSGGTAHNISLSGAISGAGSITKTGGGTLTLSGANSYTGNTAINAGIVNAGVVDNGTTGPFGKPATVVGSIAFVSGTLQYSGANNTDYSGRFVITGSQPISIDTAGQTVAFATQIQGAGTTLTKTGNGKLNLTVAAGNTYTGNTTVNGGTLAVNNTSGSGTGSGNVAVNSGGLLGGNGIISGTVTVASGGGIAPGNSVGTLTVGSLTLNSGSVNNFEFNSTPANDQDHRHHLGRIGDQRRHVQHLFRRRHDCLDNTRHL